MDFAFDARTEELRARLLAFMDEHVYPAEQVAHEQRERLSSPWENPPVVEELKAEARAAGPVEPVPARRRVRRRTHQPPVRPARRDHRPVPAARADRHQLRGARHRQHGGAGAVRRRAAEEAVAGAAAGGRDPFGVRDDRAGRGLLRRHQHHHAHQAGGRRVRRLGPQVVHLRGHAPGLHDLHRDGQDRPGRAGHPPPAVHGPGPARHPGRHREAGHAGLRLRGPLPRRPRRGDLRRGARAGVEPSARRAAGSPSRRRGSVRAGSITACG